MRRIFLLLVWRRAYGATVQSIGQSKQMTNKHSGHALLSDDDDGQVGSSPVLGHEAAADGVSQLQYALYLREAGSAAQVSMGDIHQGWGLGDCFMLSALSEIARQSVIQGNASFIPRMIHPNADGSETVTLYALNAGRWGPVQQVVHNDFPAGGVNYTGSPHGVVGHQKEIWPQVIEQAFAQQSGGYAAIAGGGWTPAAMQTLTGQYATAIPTAGMSYAKMRTMTDNNALICMDTLGSDTLPYGLVGGHSYAFNGYAGTGAVNLYNPWGYAQPAPIPIAALADGSAGIFAVDVGHFKLGGGHGVNL